MYAIAVGLKRSPPRICLAGSSSSARNASSSWDRAHSPCSARKASSPSRMATIAAVNYRFLHSTAVAKKRIKAREQARRADKQQPSEADI